jgi:hypothetical protein
MFVDFESLTHHLALIVSDPPSLQSFRAQHPDFVTLCRDIAANDGKADDGPKPFPPIPKMNAIQAAIFDNWPGGKQTKNHPNRYGMAIEIWTLEPSRINVTKRGSYQHKGNVRLMDGKELKKRIAGLQSPKLRNPISESYAAALIDVQAGMEPGDYVGLIATKTPEEGTFYHDMQFVFVKLAGEGTGCVLCVGDDQMMLPRFSSKQPNGALLAGASVILQSRADRCGFSSTWATPDVEADQ